MVSYRPLGVTILAVIIIIIYGTLFLIGLALLFGGLALISSYGPEGGIISIIGFAFLILAFLRLSMGFGMLKLRRKAWKSAMIVFGIGLIIDIFIFPGQVILDIIIIVYLLIVKKHFTY